MNDKHQFEGKTFRNILSLAASVCLLLVVTGSALAQQVRVDFDKTTDFSKYKTYTWINGTPGKLRRVVRVGGSGDLLTTGSGRSFPDGETYDDNGRQAGRDDEGRDDEGGADR